MPEVSAGRQEFCGMMPSSTPLDACGKGSMTQDAGNSGARVPRLEPYQLLDERETAQVLKCSVSKLQKDRVSGCGLRFVKIGRAIRYRTEDIIVFIEKNSRRSTSEINKAS